MLSMQFALSRVVLVCALCAFAAVTATTKPPQPQQQQQQQPAEPQAQQKEVQATKLKRDAGLSFGSGIYHGPSHKYLPPAASHGYESTYAQLHGNGLASSSGFDFASLDTDSGHHGPQHHQSYHHQQHHQHHFGHQPHTYQSLSSHHGHGRPVYISSASVAAAAAAAPVSGGFQHRPHAPKVETYIVQTSSGNSGGSAVHGHGHGHGHSLGHGLGHGLGGGYKYSNHGSTGYLSLLGGGAHKHHGSGGNGGSTSTTYFLASPAYNSIGGGSGSSSSSGSSNSGPAHGLSFGHGFSSHGHGLSSHYAPGLDHEQHSTFNYEAPSVHFKQPLNSYGVPLLPGYEHDHHEEAPEHHEHQLHHEEHQQLPAEKSHADHQTPAYALGQKGLGHFTYTSSKPLALNTDIHQHEDHNELVAELSKVPFKPSAFLGAKHEASAGYDYATPTTQFLQSPTAGGYDYPAPAVLYGAPGQSGESATPIFEPESTYLPPLSSYGQPATNTHNYH